MSLILNNFEFGEPIRNPTGNVKELGQSQEYRFRDHAGHN